MPTLQLYSSAQKALIRAYVLQVVDHHSNTLILFITCWPMISSLSGSVKNSDTVSHNVVSAPENEESIRRKNAERRRSDALVHPAALGGALRAEALEDVLLQVDAKGPAAAVAAVNGAGANI